MQLLRDRFEGAILGTLVGDALGAPVEGWNCERMNDTLDRLRDMDLAQRSLTVAVLGLITGGEVLDGMARYTDDGQMTLGVAESLVAFPEFDGPDMARRFAENFEGQRGYGPGAYGVLLALRNGATWDEPAHQLFGGKGSFGNGAAMRAAPVGLLYHRNTARLRRVADAQSTITHTNVLGRQGAVLQAAFVAQAVNTPPGTFDPLLFLAQATEAAGILETKYEDGLNDVKNLIENPAPRCEAAELLVCGIEAHLSVPAAAYAFLSHPYDFASAVTYAVRLGGDTDTIGAMCGAIAGAYHGASSIPTAWLAALENGPKGRDYAQTLARDLFAVWQEQES